MIRIPGPSALLPLALCLTSGCDRGNGSDALFEALPPEATGISFVNELPEQPGINIIDYLYYYNGGGVAAGDVDGNGLPDLYFTSNLGLDRLYLNRGDYRFEDVTERAGVGGAEGWTSGVTMADVNGDDHLDIYVSGVNYLSMRGRNILYVNDGDATFTDRTREYGLEHVGYSTQALFFDYDGDGDLDMYLLNQSTHAERAKTEPLLRMRHPAAGDRLFRNDGGHFVDVSEAAGIHSGGDAYGLGVVASDVNLDGCIDLYVANDFQENDFLYLNDCDGTFTESLPAMTGHTSRFSMGADAADVDNDGRPDIFVADMLPEREEILKTSANAESFRTFEMRMEAGYHPQYARNTLQLNRGGGRFSEIGYLAGVHATDWSWATLFADLDNDGDKDLFVTNGIPRRPNDMDYIRFVAGEAVQATLEGGVTAENLAILQRMPQVPLANFAFRNNGDLTFTNRAEAWGLGEEGFSNGAVYVDLNNSGALDLVVSNINAPASIYRNRSRELSGHHYLKLRLRGEGANRDGIGARVIIHHDGRTQMLEQVPTRGFQSSVDPRLHFGLGGSKGVDSLTIVWPDRRVQMLTNLPVDTVLTLLQADARGLHHPPAPPPTPLFEDVTARTGIDFVHLENSFFDQSREPLMPHRLSTEGPALAVADVNGDALDDLYVGGAKWQAGRLLLQNPDGTFRPRSEETFSADSLHEDVDAAFFDANGDDHPDLYVVSGGNEFWGAQEALRDRLYLNDGDGGFRRAAEALPAIFENGGSVAPADFDGDGDIDLFVGSRVVAMQYGRIPGSHLLRNDGSGNFVDVTAEVAPDLAEAGMVSAATWVVGAGGEPPELVVVGEWMPVRVFRLVSGRLTDRTAEAGLGGTEGWWNCVSVADLNRDGRADLVLGNLGLNSFIRASAEEPARLYVHDFARNGSTQSVLTSYRNGVSYPLAGRDELLEAIPQLRSRYPTYAEFGASRVEDIFAADDLRGASIREARLLASSVALRRADGTYDLSPLPREAQFAPIYAIQAEDFDGDGAVDLLAGGNFGGVTPIRGRYDASYGLFLRGSGDGRFQAIDLEHSGVAIEGEVRGMRALRLAGGGRGIVVARNADSLRVLRPTTQSVRVTRAAAAPR